MRNGVVFRGVPIFVEIMLDIPQHISYNENRNYPNRKGADIMFENVPKRRKRKPRYLYNTVLTLVGALCVLVIIFSVGGIINTLRSSMGDPSGDATGGTQDSVSLQDPTGSDPTVPSSHPTDPSSQPTDPVPTHPGYDADAVAQLIADADFIAAGYDYQKAIAMLTAFEGYDEIPAITSKIAEYEDLDSKLVVYSRPDTVTHIFFHALIVDTARAFDGDVDHEGYHTYMTTIDEFIAMMEEMYARGYVLISPYDLAYEVTDENGNKSFQYGQIRLPEGKIPFIMSQDDVNYYSYMISSGNGKNETPYWNDEANDGFASRIVIGEDGYPTCEYVDADGNLLYGDYDLVPVLETFIQAHPDFSYHGARAVLGVTGYEGVLGYRTKPSYEAAMGTEAYKAEVEAAKAVAQCLKDHGWIIASHTYGHPAYGSISASALKTDSDKWEKTCEYIVGETDIILYPYGSDIHNWKKYDFSNEKFATLYEDGYRYFFNVDSSICWNQLGANYFRGGRRNLDGYRMYHNPDLLADLFDVSKVWDPDRPNTAPLK